MFVKIRIQANYGMIEKLNFYCWQINMYQQFQET